MQEKRSYVRISSNLYTGIEKIKEIPKSWEKTAVPYLSADSFSLPTKVDKIESEDMLRLLFSAIGEIKEDMEQIKEKLGITEQALTRLPVELSGSGISSKCFPKSLKEGDVVMLSVVLPLHIPIKVKAVGVVQSDEEQKGEKIKGIEFKKITDDDRELIIKYTFQRQRELINAQKQN